MNDVVTSIFVVYFDESSRDWSPVPAYNALFLRSQENYANDLLRSRGNVFLNEVFDMLGMTRTSLGSITGWLYHEGGNNRISFGLDKEQSSEDRFLLDFNVAGIIYDKI